MAQRTLPNLGLIGFFDLGEDGWKDEMDLNLLRLSVLVQGGVLDKLAGELVSPTAGDVIILDETHPTEPNAVAVYDDGAWVYFIPNEGWLMFNQAQNYYEKFDGTVWAELATGGGGGGLTDAPSDGGIYGRQDGTWVEVPTGGGSGGGSKWTLAETVNLSGTEAIVDIPNATEVRFVVNGMSSTSSTRGRWVLRSGGSDVGSTSEVTFFSSNGTSVATSQSEVFIGGSDTSGAMNGVIELFAPRKTDSDTFGETMSWSGGSATRRDTITPAADHDQIRFYLGAGTFDAGTIEVWYLEEVAGGGSADIKQLTKVTDTNLRFEAGDGTDWSLPTNWSVLSTYEGLPAPASGFAAYRDTGQGSSSFTRTVDLTGQFSNAVLDSGTTMDISSYLGRWSADDDEANLSFQFLDAADAAVGPIYEQGLTEETGDIWQTPLSRVQIPSGARKIALTFSAVSNSGATANVAFGGVDMWIEQSVEASVASSRQHAIFRSDVAAGAASGTAIDSAWTRRDFNTEVLNEIVGASLVGNQFVLPAGKYKWRSWAAYYRTARVSSRLYNVTDSADVIIGESSYSDNGADADQVTPKTEGIFTLGAEKTLELQYYAEVSTGGTNGLGVNNAVGAGVIGIFAQVEVEKIG